MSWGCRSRPRAAPRHEKQCATRRDQPCPPAAPVFLSHEGTLPSWSGRVLSRLPGVLDLTHSYPPHHTLQTSPGGQERFGCLWMLEFADFFTDSWCLLADPREVQVEAGTRRLMT